MTSAAGLSVHVVDIAQGVPAAGMRVDLVAIASDDVSERIIDGGRLDPEGKISPERDTVALWIPCRFELRLHVAEYYRTAGGDPASAPFIDVLPFRFGIEDADRHHHLPAKITPWGVSLFLTR